jgi:hypothetical protein
MKPRKLTLGIDIAGAPGRQFDLALINWENSEVFWERMPLGTRGKDYPTYDFNQIRIATADGDIEKIAELSYNIVRHVGERLRNSFNNFNIILEDIDIIAIDSPSGFSRNTIGHGRATEKVWRYFLPTDRRRGFIVNFQMSPSISCGRERGNHWSWIIFGMGAFHTIDNNFQFDKKTWLNFIQNGIRNKEKVIEIFPRVTIQSIRMQGNDTITILIKILNNLRNSHIENGLIKIALYNGKRTGNDRADSLIAALTTLPFVYPDRFRSITLKNANPRNYNPINSIPWDREGVIYTLMKN